jgi:hypothetical protein
MSSPILRSVIGDPAVRHMMNTIKFFDRANTVHGLIDTLSKHIAAASGGY